MGNSPSARKEDNDTRFTNQSTAFDVVDGHDLSQKYAVVTGANQGIGKETARALAKAGATVVICSRSIENGNTAADDVRTSEAESKVLVAQLDLADLRQTRSCAEELTRSLPRLDFLVLNAGVGASAAGRRPTAQGLEACFGVNHVGHAVFAQGLLGKMQQQEGGGRIVVVSSQVHSMGKLDWGDLQWERRPYKALQAYGDSKLANVLFAQELARRVAGSGVSVFSLHPGVVMTTMGRQAVLWLRVCMMLASPLLQTVQQGAACSVYACVTPGLESKSGGYLSHCQFVEPGPNTRDPSLAPKLWEVTSDLIAKAFPDDCPTWPNGVGEKVANQAVA